LCVVGFLFAGCSSGAATEEDSIAISQEAIVGGTIASQYPEAGVVNVDVGQANPMFCSAALIAPRVVLTAGRCVNGRSSWLVRFGSQTRTTTSATAFVLKQTDTSKAPPPSPDIALIFLNDPIVIPNYPKVSATPLTAGSKVTYVGRNDNGVVRESLYAADAEVRDGALNGFPGSYMSRTPIQTGDVGGPAFAPGTHTIMAVNSIAASAGDAGQVQLFARVDLVREWIMQQIEARGGYAPGGDASAPRPGDDTRDGSVPPRFDGGSETRDGASGGVPPNEGGEKTPPRDGSTPLPNIDAGPPRDGSVPPSDGGATRPDGGTPPPQPQPGPSCPLDTASNDSWTTASPLPPGIACGNLPTGDKDWFRLEVPVGMTNLMVVGPPDVSMSIGQATESTCTPNLSGLRSLVLSSAVKESRRYCILVQSSSTAPVSYALARE